MDFTISEFNWHWRDYQKVIPENNKSLAILNAMTDEQKEAVRIYGRCRYSEGNYDGYQEGQNES
jgi:hypothetical protein